ncbi:hypothetical protein SAMN05518849_13719 [Sphingobium sp. AP50]|uniref:DUF2171 domain-containing protein n=1 Tax=Sphingobium sp. AP50 TaxID=1884369 RepID=UPI0008B34C23|nr:DUF2171 domain-containing protein [Sphingobium sp. AP50]SEK05575.1 hypothetical protein SAMN05518849_13719 [Sphingobium sp. AP50]
MAAEHEIQEHMEILGSDGDHVGTVDSVDEGRIKLTRADSADGLHHYLDLEQVDRVENGKVYLIMSTFEAHSLTTAQA